ncbi:hypothetical protein SPBR_05591 [Sporothrix brasiliensis 5110]|uniref:Uncharacterized protein n=1 Tax=Sporothrix brasiliensis 5110 TaxID=1398154 RepID=A0A0C2J5I0_9PEZI|nr:uncharacterized protein SPBR_05591 [Sporothrix brasiliensis 5110]KIH94240.1 hypothetical protein SPBR_05591 [Sporothrix brasiliensis 5110]
MELVGVVRSPLASFHVYGQSHLGRDYTRDDVGHLSDTFRTSGYFPTREENLIEALITQSDFSSILAQLGLTQAQLATTLCLPNETTNATDTNYPLLLDYPLAVLHGRRRVAAGIRSKQTNWWATKLFCVKGTWVNFPSAITFNEAADAELVQYKAESFSHEAAYSAGTIYRGVIEARRHGDEEREDLLRDRLTKPRDVSLQGLLKNKRLNAAFQKLIPFPGLLKGLQLRNIHKDLALHCDEQIEHYLGHILATWVGITGGNASLALATDADTVKHLQFRAPSSYSRDRYDISRLIVNHTVWKRVTDVDTRKRLERQLLSLTVVIPSIETLHENMKYLRLGMKVVRDHFKQHTSRELPRGATSASATTTVPTLYESLTRDWKAPAAAPQVPDLQGIQNLTPYTAYTALVLATLRDFPHLQAEAPRQEKRGPRLPTNVSQYHKRRLTQLAVAYGFDNSHIQDILQRVHPSQDAPRNEHCTDRLRNSPGPIADWRGGRPFTKAYLALQTDGFLHILARQPVDVLCPAFVLCDFMKAFFDLSQLTITSTVDEPTSNSTDPSDTIMDSTMGEPTTDVPDIANTTVDSAAAEPTSNGAGPSYTIIDSTMDEPKTDVPDIADSTVDSVAAESPFEDVSMGEAVNSGGGGTRASNNRRFAGNWAKRLPPNNGPPGSTSGKTRRLATQLGAGPGRATSSTPTPTMPPRRGGRGVTKQAQRADTIPQNDAALSGFLADVVQAQTGKFHFPVQASMPEPDTRGAGGNGNQTMPQRLNVRPPQTALSGDALLFLRAVTRNAPPPSTAVARDTPPPLTAVAQDAPPPPTAVARGARPPSIGVPPIREMRSTKKLRKLPQDQQAQESTRWFVRNDHRETPTSQGPVYSATVGLSTDEFANNFAYQLAGQDTDEFSATRLGYSIEDLEDDAPSRKRGAEVLDELPESATRSKPSRVTEERQKERQEERQKERQKERQEEEEEEEEEL